MFSTNFSKTLENLWRGGGGGGGGSGVISPLGLTCYSK